MPLPTSAAVWVWVNSGLQLLHGQYITFADVSTACVLAVGFKVQTLSWPCSQCTMQITWPSEATTQIMAIWFPESDVEMPYNPTPNVNTTSHNTFLALGWKQTAYQDCGLMASKGPDSHTVSVNICCHKEWRRFLCKWFLISYHL